MDMTGDVRVRVVAELHYLVGGERDEAGSPLSFVLDAGQPMELRRLNKTDMQFTNTR
jgi:hypothetical protein